MSQSLISIIVPIYKVEKYLDKCVESLICQTYKNIEIILVDDGSPDNCPKMCDEWAKKDNRIKVIHKKNGGLSDARNAGIDVSLGDCIMFIDSDDYIHPDTLEKMYKRICDDESDMAICNLSYVDENGREIPEMNKINVENKTVDEVGFWNELYGLTNYAYCVISCNKLIKKSVFNNLRYDLGKLHEDEFIIHKIVSQCNKISFLNDKFYFYVQRDQSIMTENYSVRHLDAAQALINRSEYLLSKNLIGLAEKALTYSVGTIMLGYRKLNLKEKQNIDRINELLGMYRKVYFKIAKCKNASLKFKLNGLTFYIGPKFYKITH